MFSISESEFFIAFNILLITTKKDYFILLKFRLNKTISKNRAKKSLTYRLFKGENLILIDIYHNLNQSLVMEKKLLQEIGNLDIYGVQS
jgi:hypothetical protein